jgi:hypothetical protein
MRQYKKIINILTRHHFSQENQCLCSIYFHEWTVYVTSNETLSNGRSWTRTPQYLSIIRSYSVYFAFAHSSLQNTEASLSIHVSSISFNRMNYIQVLIFSRTKGEVSEQFRMLQNEELRDLSQSPNIVRIVKPRRL